MNDKIEIAKSSGNLFADLGRANPQEDQLKSDLAYRLSLAIRERGLTQQQAADVLGIDQPKVSALMRGRISGVSVERLLQHITAFDNDVEIVVHPKVATEERATVRVHDSVAALAALQRGTEKLGSLRAGAMAEKAGAERERRRGRKAAATHVRIVPD